MFHVIQIQISIKTTGFAKWFIKLAQDIHYFQKPSPNHPFRQKLHEILRIVRCQSLSILTSGSKSYLGNVNIPSTDAQRVVIIGGGFGGLQLAKKLRNKNFQVVLLDKHNYHAFQPLFYQVATAGLEPGSIAYPFRKIFNSYLNYFFRMAEVTRIDTTNKKVETNIGDISYEYLVIATGATTNFFGMKNIEKLAMPMKTVSEALDIRSLMLQNLEQALLTNDVMDKDSLMGIVIVGGGPTGVELAGALAELKKDILPKDYPDLDMRVMDIHLIDSNARVLKEFSEESSANAHKTLAEMGRSKEGVDELPGRHFRLVEFMSVGRKSGQIEGKPSGEGLRGSFGRG